METRDPGDWEGESRGGAFIPLSPRLLHHPAIRRRQKKKTNQKKMLFLFVCPEFICANSEGSVLLRNGPEGCRLLGRRRRRGGCVLWSFLCLTAASAGVVAPGSGSMADIFIKRNNIFRVSVHIIAAWSFFTV